MYPAVIAIDMAKQVFQLHWPAAVEPWTAWPQGK